MDTSVQKIFLNQPFHQVNTSRQSPTKSDPILTSLFITCQASVRSLSSVEFAVTKQVAPAHPNSCTFVSSWWELFFSNYARPLLPQDSAKTPFSLPSFPWFILTQSDLIYLWIFTIFITLFLYFVLVVYCYFLCVCDFKFNHKLPDEERHRASFYVPCPGVKPCSLRSMS